jgi:alpha-methylacyl-CoA racemase
MSGHGPLRGVRIVEFFGIGPGPFAAMMLGDMGADVVSLVRPGRWVRDARQFINRNRRVVELDLKNATDAHSAWKLVESADALIEGFRPGVMERLGFSPEETLRRRPRLVYGRMTGWGQEGPLAQTAGHDLNYIAVAGALDSFRASNGEPVQPLNLVGDYGGGALFLVVGLLAALLEARHSGTGQVVDAAMCDGTAALLALAHSMRATGRSSDVVGTNLLDGGAHFYHTYACADGRHIAVACLEPQFYAEMRRIARLDSSEFDDQMNRALWPQLKLRMQEVFRTKTSAEWMALFEGTDACVTPVVPLDEAPTHPHLVARGTFVQREGYVEPSPAPRFSRTPSSVRRLADAGPTPVEDVLSAWRSP